jgi:hypothetical protein
VHLRDLCVKDLAASKLLSEQYTADKMKFQVVWDFMLCRLVNLYRRFDGPLCIYLQGTAVVEESLM